MRYALDGRSQTPATLTHMRRGHFRDLQRMGDTDNDCIDIARTDVTIEMLSSTAIAAVQTPTSTSTERKHAERPLIYYVA